MAKPTPSLTTGSKALSSFSLFAVSFVWFGACPSPDPGALVDSGKWCPGAWIAVDGQDFCTFGEKKAPEDFQCPSAKTFYGGGDTLWAACGPPPSDGTPSDDRLEREIVVQDGLQCGPLKLDVLVVLDNTGSMSGRLNHYAAALERFASGLGEYAPDLHLAVTTMNARCEVDLDAQITGVGGAFNNRAATEAHLGLMTGDHRYCVVDEDCGTAGQWVCNQKTPSCIENPNGSVNTSCRRLCLADPDCVERLGPEAVCLRPGGPRDTGCVVPPTTAECTNPLNPIITDDTLDNVRCVANPWSGGAKCTPYEEGFRSAWLALDPAGPHAAQSSAFLRPDAQLLLVFISSHDDCSTATEERLDPELDGNCALLPDEDSDGPLASVSKMAQRFRALKADPDSVAVLAISGDSLADSEADRVADRQAYVASKTAAPSCHVGSFICQSSLGTFHWGARYRAFTEQFGERGFFRNECAPETTDAALASLAGRSIKTHLERCTAP